MYKRILETGAICLMLILLMVYTNKLTEIHKTEVYIEEENKENTLGDEITGEEKEAIFRQILEIDYAPRIYPIDEKLYTAKMDRACKEAFLKVLTNQLPIGTEYFRDNFRGITDINNEQFIKSVTKGFKYYYLDYDGDGLPELVVDTEYDGLRILKYIPKTDTVVEQKATPWGYYLLGAGQIYHYHPDLRTTYGYSGNGEKVTFTILYGYEPIKYMVAIQAEIRDGEYCEIEISKEEWDILTKDLFAAVEQAPSPLSYEEVFGDISLIYPPQSQEDEEEVLKLYKDFLEGEIAISGMLNLESLCDIQEAKYVIWDIDGDGVSEMVLQDAEMCFFLKVWEGSLKIWRHEVKEKGWYYILESGQVLKVDPGDSKLDISKYYLCYTLEFNGEETGLIYFAQIDENGNGVFDTEDTYRFSGYNCTREEWIEKTKDYLNTDKDGIGQIQKAVEWIECQ